MKVVHVLKKIESIDSDIKDLRRMEKSLQKNKSFTTPIFLSIEKQINILLGERIKLLELKIENPPEYLVDEIEDRKPEDEKPVEPGKPEPRKARAKKARPSPAKEKIEEIDDEDIPILTQDFIDEKIKNIEKEAAAKPPRDQKSKERYDDDTVKLLDIALEKGTLDKSAIEKEKRKVKFFRNNFPGSEY